MASFNRGQQLLDQHSIELFGAYFENSRAHIMVTLSTDCAWDYPLLCNLLNKGMTGARINCAHDNQPLWEAMIRNLRRAETETGRSCRILMDLAGHKIRTGPIQPGPAIHHLQVKHDDYGRALNPARLILCLADHGPHPEDAQFRICLPAHFFNLLTAGNTLHFKDARDKPRSLKVESRLSATEWQASCWQNSYLPSASLIELETAQDAKPNAAAISCRIGEFAGREQEIRLFKNDQLLLTDYTLNGAPAEYADNGELLKPAQIGCTLSVAIQRLQIGQPVWIDDGKLGAEVEAITEQGLLLRVVQARSNGVCIHSDKGINFPGAKLGLPALSDKDLEDLDFACRHVDLIGFSFVESLADMEYLIGELAKRSATDLPIIAKIETNQAVKNLPEIILGTIGRHSLGIMIARGDLAVELGSARLAEIQEELLWLCEAAHVPVIWATQVLESIAKKGTKSRPEFTDAAMAVRAECVMLNKGPFIVDALEALRNVMTRMHEHQRKKYSRLRALQW
jgi:pyruvate kinase